MINTLLTKFTNWRRFQVSVRELSRLSDRELHDLGIGRDDIGTVARHAARSQGA